MIEPGTLNSRIVIQHLTQVVDDIGDPIDTWAQFAKAWANIRHLNGSETIKAGAEASVLKASIRIHYRTDLNAGMRVLHKGTTYEIKAVLPDEVKHAHVDLVCEVIS